MPLPDMITVTDKKLGTAVFFFFFCLFLPSCLKQQSVWFRKLYNWKESPWLQNALLHPQCFVNVFFSSIMKVFMKWKIEDSSLLQVFTCFTNACARSKLTTERWTHMNESLFTGCVYVISLIRKYNVKRKRWRMKEKQKECLSGLIKEVQGKQRNCFQKYGKPAQDELPPEIWKTCEKDVRGWSWAYIISGRKEWMDQDLFTSSRGLINDQSRLIKD